LPNEFSGPSFANLAANLWTADFFRCDFYRDPNELVTILPMKNAIS